MIVDVIVSDLVPLRERGNFIAIVLTVYSLGTTVGPFVGGAIVESTTWRWVFYLNCMLRHPQCPLSCAGLMLGQCPLEVLPWSSSSSFYASHITRK